MSATEYSLCWNTSPDELLVWPLRTTTDSLVSVWTRCAAPSPSWASAYLAFGWRDVKHGWKNVERDEYVLRSGRAANDSHLSLVPGVT